MAAIRLIFQTSDSQAEPLFRTIAQQARSATQCAQAEVFRSIEHDEHLLLLEAWDSPADWDAHWQDLRDSPEGRGLIEAIDGVQPPFQFGTPAAPRSSGRNGLEFYRQAYFFLENDVWRARDTENSAATIRWPTTSPIRILIQITADPGADTASWIAGSIETRAEPGCVQFEYFRSLDFPENIAVLESWADAALYDVHWLNRLLQRRAGGNAGGAAQKQPERQYGRSGFEWYNEAYYVLCGGAWVSEEITKRSATIVW